MQNPAHMPTYEHRVVAADAMRSNQCQLLGKGMISRVRPGHPRDRAHASALQCWRLSTSPRSSRMRSYWCTTRWQRRRTSSRPSPNARASKPGEWANNRLCLLLSVLPALQVVRQQNFRQSECSLLTHLRSLDTKPAMSNCQCVWLHGTRTSHSYRDGSRTHLWFAPQHAWPRLIMRCDPIVLMSTWVYFTDTRRSPWKHG